MRRHTKCSVLPSKNSLPVYHNIKTIFVRVPKTATTSICEKLYTADTFAKYFVGGEAKSNNTTQEVEKHESIRQIRSNTPEDQFKDYFKVGFVRNPWDWLVSYHSYYNTYGSSEKKVLKEGKYQRISNRFAGLSFGDFLSKVEEELEEYNMNEDHDRSSQVHYPHQPQHKYLVDDDGIVIDFVGRYENLQEAWSSLRDKLNIDNRYRDMELSRLNTSEREEYRTYYKDKDIERVHELYKRDIELFEYSY